MTNFVEQLRLALRRLIREPGFSTTAIVTVAVGIGIAASVFALVDGVLIRPLPYPDSDRLVSVRHSAPGIEFTQDGVSAGVYLHYRDNNRVFDGIGGYDEIAYTLTDGAAERIQAAAVTPEIFALLRVDPLVGRAPTAADYDHDVSTGQGTTGALISHELWVRRYGADPDIVGRGIEVDGKPWMVVTGVTRPGFAFPDPATELWLVVPQDNASWSARAAVRRGMFLKGVARLRPGVTMERAEADLNRLVHLLPEAFPDITAQDIGSYGLRAEVRPFKDEIVADVRLTLLLVLGSAAFLLLVTWANVANLLLTRTHDRRAEIGITRALGASEGHVASRLLSESLLLTLTGALLGLGLAWFAVSARFGFAPRQLPRLDEVGVNGTVIALVAALAVVSGALMGAICLASTRQGVAGPALSALRSRSATPGPEGQTGRRILVASQLALALTLLVGTGLMARTFWQLQEVDLGFHTAERLTLYVPITHLSNESDHHEYASLYDRVLRQLRELPGVHSVETATTSVFPLTLPEAGGDPAVIAPAGEAMDGVDRWPLAQYGYATPGYFELMGIPLIAGRTFLSQDASVEASGAIISESLARDLFADVDPIGRSIEFAGWGSFWHSTHTVVGVVGDVPATTLRDGWSRAIYLPHVFPLAANVSSETLHPYVPRFETITVRSARDHTSLVPELRQALHEVDPRLPVLDVAPVGEIVAEATAQERFALRLLLVSAGAALFLSIIGIYGVLAYSVRRRTAEIGVRIALGATPGRVTRMVVLQGALLSAAGIAVGLAGALGLTRFIGSLLYGTSPTDPLTFTSMTLLLFTIALAASYVPARRASRIDPAHALRASD